MKTQKVQGDQIEGAKGGILSNMGDSRGEQEKVPVHLFKYQSQMFGVQVAKIITPKNVEKAV